MFKVESGKFEGPLNLLLQLIEKEKLDICEISLAKITDGYLSRVSEIEGSGEEMAEFLLIAAKLLYIKSKQLLPNSATDEEEEEIADLEARLLEYQKYKEAAKNLEEILAKGNRGFRRQAKNEQIINFMPPKGLDSTKLYAIFQEAINKAKDEAQEEEVLETPKVSIEEKRDNIRQIIKKSKKVSFKTILFNAKSKVEVIVSFLAILEMIKQKEIKVTQDNNFADFMIEGVK